jgi:hypothetical protein
MQRLRRGCHVSPLRQSLDIVYRARVKRIRACLQTLWNFAESGSVAVIRITLRHVAGTARAMSRYYIYRLLIVYRVRYARLKVESAATPVAGIHYFRCTCVSVRGWVCVDPLAF